MEREHLLGAEESEHENVLLENLRSFGVNSGMLVTFYNAVICSIIVYGSVCWGGNISKCDRGRLEKIVKKKKKKVGHVAGVF